MILPTLKPSEDDVQFGILEDTEIDIIKNGYSATGGLLKCYLGEIHPTVEVIASILGSVGANPLQLKDQELINYRTYYGELLETSKIDIPCRTDAFTFLLKRTNKIAAEKRDQLDQALKTAQSKWKSLIQRLPIFFYRKADKHLSLIQKDSMQNACITMPQSRKPLPQWWRKL